MIEKDATQADAEAPSSTVASFPARCLPPSPTPHAGAAEAEAATLGTAPARSLVQERFP